MSFMATLYTNNNELVLTVTPDISLFQNSSLEIYIGLTSGSYLYGRACLQIQINWPAEKRNENVYELFVGGYDSLWIAIRF